jgi:hypothetical protein
MPVNLKEGGGEETTTINQSLLSQRQFVYDSIFLN